MQIVAPAGAKGHALQSGQPIEAICLRYIQRVRVHRRTALHLKEVTHRSTSLNAVEVLVRLIRAVSRVTRAPHPVSRTST